jgi:hypothetical protein
VISDEDLAVLKQHETHNLEELLVTKESFIQWCVAEGYPEEIPEQEQVVSVIKGELGRRGAFDDGQ